MPESLSSTVVMLVSSLLAMVVTFCLVRWDRHHSSPEERRGEWTWVTTAVAVVFFAPLCLLPYYWVTRRSLRGVLQGLVATVVVSVAVMGCTYVITLLMGE